jgi:hypothetical protein
MQDRPTAVELLQIAQEFCERDLIPNLDGRVRFHARVLKNVLGILEREWLGEEDAIRAEWARLQKLLGTTTPSPPTFTQLLEEVAAANRELSSRIRAGELDDRWEEAVQAVHETVEAKLAIANPRYSATASSEGASSSET